MSAILSCGKMMLGIRWQEKNSNETLLDDEWLGGDIGSNDLGRKVTC